jgi:hypothetical protein
VKALAATSLPGMGLAENQIDDVLAGSFPASDPPSWNLSRAEADPADSQTAGPARPAAMPVHPTSGAAAPSRGRSAWRFIVSTLGAIALPLLLPIFVVLLPFALLYRLVLSATGWSRRPDLNGAL